MPKQNSDSEHPVVLIVDGDLGRRRTTGIPSELTQAGVVGVVLPDAFQALERFGTISPDIAILGETGPRMDRFALCAAFHSFPEETRAHVLVVTDPRDDGSIQRALAAGANGFVPSPVDWTALGHHLAFLWREIRSRRTLLAGERRHRQFIKAVPDTLLRLDRNGIILDLEGPRDSELAQFLHSSVGGTLQGILSLDDSIPASQIIEQSLKERASSVLSHRLPLNHRTYMCETSLVPSESGEMIAILRDVTLQKRHEEELLQMACRDSLTGLQTRQAFRELLSGTVAQAKREGRIFAVLFLDLNRFQRINETFGPAGGDLLLRRVADRIIHCTRKGDWKARLHPELGSNPLARLGGDQFAILLEPIEHARDGARVARRILDAMMNPFVIEDNEIVMTACIGISVFPDDGDNADTLLMNAHKAMQDARQRGENTFSFFAHSENAKAIRELNIESSLRKALDRGELFLVYQPQVDIQTGRIVGVEALLRWEHPELGVIPPPQFIPVAERTGLIVPIGEWVLSIASLQSKIWQKANFPAVRVAVNLSARQFRQKKLVEVVKRTLVKTGLDPSMLELEITEGTAMHNAESTIRVLNELKELGVKLSIDDFGTGYSSLSYLKRFPLDVLKIDRAFVKDVHMHPDSQAIARAILAMAGSLNLSVIAEGVETPQELDFLKGNGCDVIQGYLFSPPLPAMEMTALLNRGATLEAIFRRIPQSLQLVASTNTRRA